MKEMTFDLIYNNVVFQTVAKKEVDVENILNFVNYTRENGTSMVHMACWLAGHGFEYDVRFEWREEFSLWCNLWNLYSYIRFRLFSKHYPKGK